MPSLVDVHVPLGPVAVTALVDHVVIERLMTVAVRRRRQRRGVEQRDAPQPAAVPMAAPRLWLESA